MASKDGLRLVPSYVEGLWLRCSRIATNCCPWQVVVVGCSISRGGIGAAGCMARWLDSGSGCWVGLEMASLVKPARAAQAVISAFGGLIRAFAHEHGASPSTTDAAGRCPMCGMQIDARIEWVLPGRIPQLASWSTCAAGSLERSFGCRGRCLRWCLRPATLSSGTTGSPPMPVASAFEYGRCRPARGNCVREAIGGKRLLLRAQVSTKRLTQGREPPGACPMIA
jgi:hypothetical protein